MIISHLYLLVAIITGVISFSEGSMILALSGILGPVLGWWGGSGLKGSFYGSVGQKIGGLIAASIFLFLGIYFVSETGYWIKMWDIKINGTMWIVIGFMIGLITTPSQKNI